MVVRVRLDPIATTLRVMVDSMASEKAQKAAIASFARNEIAKGDAINRRALGYVPPKEITVDGRRDAPLETVKVNGGFIVVEWELFTSALLWIGTELQKRSPVRSGDYVRSHLLFADGVEIPLTANPKAAEEYVFLNPIPYARKIEIGKTKSGRNFVIQVPNRIYEKVARDARSRFGNSADIKFTYRAPVGAYKLRRVPRGRKTGAGKAVTAPAIIVKIRGA